MARLTISASLCSYGTLVSDYKNAGLEAPKKAKAGAADAKVSAKVKKEQEEAKKEKAKKQAKAKRSGLFGLKWFRVGESAGDQAPNLTEY